tara:strand:- start:191 stop:1081 length:891 start_codon:yes stop_codon:yes gene_type:complete
MKRKIKFFDPNIHRKKKISDSNFHFIPNSKIPLPSEVEISESGTCNRVCSFCPRSDPNYKDIKEFISKDLHEKLLKELSQVNYAGVIRYSGFVEPLLDKNIFNLIKSARNYLPKSKIEIVTNGDVLNKERLIKLFKNGLSTILISVYDGKEDAVKFDKLCLDCNLNTSQYVIRHRYLPPEKDFGITMSNRSGMMKGAEHKIEPLKEKLNEPCYYPSYTFFLDYNGDVLMCPHDWGKKRILGNLKKDTFLNIWTSKFAKINRIRLNKSDRNFSPCNVCDVKGTLIGEKHAAAWSEQT